MNSKLKSALEILSTLSKGTSQYIHYLGVAIEVAGGYDDLKNEVLPKISTDLPERARCLGEMVDQATKCSQVQFIIDRYGSGYPNVLAKANKRKMELC